MGDEIDYRVSRLLRAAESNERDAATFRTIADQRMSLAEEQRARAAYLKGEGPAVVRER